MYFKLVAAFALGGVGGGGGGGGGGWWLLLLAPSRQEKGKKIQTRRAEAPDKNRRAARPDVLPRTGFCSGCRGNEAEPKHVARLL